MARGPWPSPVDDEDLEWGLEQLESRYKLEVTDREAVLKRASELTDEAYQQLKWELASKVSLDAVDGGCVALAAVGMALEELGYAFVAEDGFSAAESQAVVTYTNWLDLDLDEYEEMLEEGTLEIE